MDVPSIRGQEYYHLGVVVRDIGQAAERWSRRLGVDKPEPALSGDFARSGTTFRGAPTDGRAKVVILAAPGGTAIELIEPVGGPSDWTRFLEERGEGPHHLAWRVEDVPAVVSAYQEQGAQIIQTGRFTDRATGRPSRYVYLQQDPDDIVFEVLGYENGAR